MITQVQPGKLLTVEADKGEKLVRKLVSFENGVFFVCKPEEYDAAASEGRDPVCIGFRPEYVLDDDGARQ
jgi:hypothetical protein